MKLLIQLLIVLMFINKFWVLGDHNEFVQESKEYERGKTSQPAQDLVLKNSSSSVVLEPSETNKSKLNGLKAEFLNNSDDIVFKDKENSLPKTNSVQSDLVRIVLKEQMVLNGKQAQEESVRKSCGGLLLNLATNEEHSLLTAIYSNEEQTSSLEKDYKTSTDCLKGLSYHQISLENATVKELNLPKNTQERKEYLKDPLQTNLTDFNIVHNLPKEKEEQPQSLLNDIKNKYKISPTVLSVHEVPRSPAAATLANKTINNVLINKSDVQENDSETKLNIINNKTLNKYEIEIKPLNSQEINPQYNGSQSALIDIVLKDNHNKNETREFPLEKSPKDKSSYIFEEEEPSNLRFVENKEKIGISLPVDAVMKITNENEQSLKPPEKLALGSNDSLLFGDFNGGAIVLEAESKQEQPKKYGQLINLTKPEYIFNSESRVMVKSEAPSFSAFTELKSDLVRKSQSTPDINRSYYELEKVPFKTLNEIAIKLELVNRSEANIADPLGKLTEFNSTLNSQKTISSGSELKEKENLNPDLTSPAFKDVFPKPNENHREEGQEVALNLMPKSLAKPKEPPNYKITEKELKEAITLEETNFNKNHEDVLNVFESDDNSTTTVLPINELGAKPSTGLNNSPISWEAGCIYKDPIAKDIEERNKTLQENYKNFKEYSHGLETLKDPSTMNFPKHNFEETIVKETYNQISKEQNLKALESKGNETQVERTDIELNALPSARVEDHPHLRETENVQNKLRLITIEEGIKTAKEISTNYRDLSKEQENSEVPYIENLPKHADTHGEPLKVNTTEYIKKELDTNNLNEEEEDNKSTASLNSKPLWDGQVSNPHTLNHPKVDQPSVTAENKAKETADFENNPEKEEEPITNSREATITSTFMPIPANSGSYNETKNYNKTHKEEEKKEINFKFQQEQRDWNLKMSLPELSERINSLGLEPLNKFLQPQSQFENEKMSTPVNLNQLKEEQEFLIKNKNSEENSSSSEEQNAKELTSTPLVPIEEYAVKQMNFILDHLLLETKDLIAKVLQATLNSVYPRDRLKSYAEGVNRVLNPTFESDYSEDILENSQTSHQDELYEQIILKLNFMKSKPSKYLQKQIPPEWLTEFVERRAEMVIWLDKAAEEMHKEFNEYITEESDPLKYQYFNETFDDISRATEIHHKLAFLADLVKIVKNKKQISFMDLYMQT